MIRIVQIMEMLERSMLLLTLANKTCQPNTAKPLHDYESTLDLSSKANKLIIFYQKKSIII